MNHYIEALRSDGSAMWQATTSLVHQRTIYLVNGDESMTNDLLQKKSTFPQTTTTWYVPAADCALVQLRYEHEDGVTVQNLSSLVLAEPDPALFKVSESF